MFNCEWLRTHPHSYFDSGLVWSIGTVLGPVVGGGFEIVNWRWAFYINLIFGACLLPVYVFVLPSADPSPGVSLRKRAATMDFVGAILSIAAFITLIMAISFGGELYKWNSGQIIALFVVSGVLWLFFAAQQVLRLFTTAERRMFPVHLLRNKEAILLFICSSAAGSICYITVYYIPIYFQFTKGDTAIKAAVRLLATTSPGTSLEVFSLWLEACFCVSGPKSAVLVSNLTSLVKHESI